MGNHSSLSTPPTLAAFETAAVPIELLQLDGWTPQANAYFAEFLDQHDGQWPVDDIPLVGKPVAEATAAGYDASIALLLTWCADHDVDDLAAEDELTCQSLVTVWLGERAHTDAPNTLNVRRSAINAWAKQNRIPSPLTKAAKKLRGKGEPTGPAESLGVERWTAVLVALDSGNIVTPKAPSLALSCEGWYLREMAALTAVVAMSLRTASELPQFTDDCVVELTERGIHLMLPESKADPNPASVWLEYRGDLACPVTALARFLKFCDDHNVSRRGQLFPAWYRRHQLHQAATAERGRTYERSQWDRVREHCGFDGNTTLHGLRAFLPTEAVKAGATAIEVRDMLRHSSINTAAMYNRSETQPNLGLLDNIIEGGDR